MSHPSSLGWENSSGPGAALEEALPVRRQYAALAATRANESNLQLAIDVQPMSNVVHAKIGAVTLLDPCRLASPQMRLRASEPRRPRKKECN